MPPTAPRLIDLRVDWFRQYAPEIARQGDSIDDVRPRLSQVDGYFSDTSAAFVSCGRDAQGIARIEAEFSGRVLYGIEDVMRFREDPSGLTWAVLAMTDMDGWAWPAATERLDTLFNRGVRLFSPFRGEDRGLTVPAREFLSRMLELCGPRPILDLARAGPEAIGEILDWFEADEQRVRRILLVDRGSSQSRHDLARFRALGGLVAVAITESIDEFRKAIDDVATIPYRGQAGYEGITIQTQFLSPSTQHPGLGNAGEVVAWLEKSFAPAVSRLLIRDNAWKLIEAMAGGSI